MNVQPFQLMSPNNDAPIDRIASHCDPKSPVGRPTSSCHRCKLRHLKCVIRRNVEGETVGCSHCLASNDFSVVCTLANPTTFHSYCPLFHHRLLTTEDFDARKLCLRHEDASTNNAFHPPALQASDSHLHPLSGRESNNVAVDARLPNGSPGPGFADSNMNAGRVSVDARLPNGSPGPEFTDCNIDADLQCISCVREHLPMNVSPLKFQYQMKNKQTNGHIRGVRRMFYIPNHEVNTFHAHELSIGTGPDKLRILPPPVTWMFNTQSILMPILPREDVDYYRIGSDGKYVLSTVRKKKFDGASPFSKKFHSTKCHVPNDDNLCTYVVVTDENNQPYPIESLQHIAPPLKGNLLIPCLSDSIDRKQWRRFYSMSHKSYRQLLKCIPEGISTPLESDEPDAVSLFDALVECLSCAK
eukprot:scaffold11368_cov45-Cyclotella_meneghiniana.AAC.3